MVLIDKSREPRLNAKKTRAVKTRREMRDGKMVTIKIIDTDSPTLSDDLAYVFTSNVRAVTRKRK
jgi:hypothetical protein